jgi:large subunit ribosomal protein L18
MSFEINRRKSRRKRQLSGRRKVKGTPERPRLCVFKSTRHVYLQLIDDVAGTTVIAASTMEPEVRAAVSYTGNIDAAKVVGKLIAERALEAEIDTVVFDRAGCPYHGRVKAVAEAAREAGLVF